MFNPLTAVQILGRIAGDPNKLETLGSCFAFRHQNNILTAAHCVGSLAAHEMAVVGPGNNDLIVRLVQDVHRHPSADVALLRLESNNNDTSQPFLDCVGNFSLGEDFVAYGFPEDVFGKTARKPVPRLFKGYFQRFMPYKSHMGFEYLAGELNIGCPAGLSGGPLFRFGTTAMLMGLVTENHESTTVLHSEEVQTEGRETHILYRSVINYGICVMLDPLRPWLDSLVPPKQL
jgi:hypothetical protein